MKSTFRAIRHGLAAAVESLTDRLPSFRWDHWSHQGSRRWTLASRPRDRRGAWSYAMQPSRAEVCVWGLGSLTLVRVTV